MSCEVCEKFSAYEGDKREPDNCTTWLCNCGGCPEEKLEFKRMLELKGINWGDDALFFTHEWRDETSQFDTHPSVRWEGGGEYYSRLYKCRIPIAFRDCDEMIERFIEWMTDYYPDAKGFYVD